MKRAKCKCGAEPIFTAPKKTLGEYKIFCRRCRESETALNETRVIEAWNYCNTDQHGQQLTEQTIQWTEWDGVLEHFPPEGTTILIKAKSFNNFLLGELRINVHNEPVLDIWTTVRQKIKKGDQFAVVA